MFVESDTKLVLPSWARFVRGMINSNKVRRIVSGNTIAGLFNTLFFGGMGRVSLKCHTPTQTAL